MDSSGRAAFITGIIAAALILISDIYTPEISVWVAYVPVLALLERHQTGRRIAWTALLYAAAIYAGYFLSPARTEFNLISRTIGAACLAILAYRAVSRNRAEEALRQSEGLLRKVIENLPFGVWIMDKKGNVIISNPAAERIWGGGFLPMEKFGEYKGWWLSNGERVKAEEWAAARALQKGETSLCEEVEIECLDGDTHKMISNSALPMKAENGEFLGAVMVCQDITEQKELERAKMDFVFMLTHDLKSPLTTITGYSELLVGICTHERTEAKEMVKTIQRSSERMMRMIEDVLTVSKLESGKMELAPVPENLSSVLDRIHTDFIPVAEKKGIRLEKEYDGLPQACVDRKYMERSVGNLLQNAINYTPRGGKVTLKARSGHRGNGRRSGPYLAVTVEDTGPGIPEKDRLRVFDKYYSATKSNGTGLGLAIVKAVAEAHGGRAAVESEPGKGSAFHIYIPLKQSL